MTSYDENDECRTCGVHIADAHTPGFPCSEPQAVLAEVWANAPAVAAELHDLIAADEVPRWRFTDHRMPARRPGEEGTWCRASGLPVSERLATSDDRRCLHNCPDSDIEPIPVAG
jgi:hypothetical protein